MDRIMELVKERAEVMESARAKLKEKKLEEAESLTEQLKNIDTELYILRAEREDALGEGKKKQGKSLWNSAGEFFQAVYRADLKGEQADERLFKNTASGNNEATNGEGGYLVPPEYSQELIKVAMQEAVLSVDKAPWNSLFNRDGGVCVTSSVFVNIGFHSLTKTRSTPFARRSRIFSRHRPFAPGAAAH